MDATAFFAAAIIILFVSFFFYIEAPKEWQTPLGFAVIAAIIVPAGILAIAIFYRPVFLIPIALITGIALARREA